MLQRERIVLKISEFNLFVMKSVYAHPNKQSEQNRDEIQ